MPQVSKLTGACRWETCPQQQILLERNQSAERRRRRERERLMHRLLVEVLQHIYLKISKAQTSHPAIIKFVSNQQNISLPVCGGS